MTGRLQPRWWLYAELRLLAALFFLVAFPAAARAAGTLRTVLVIDASSSMRSTDPKQLRKVGAELYVDLARDGDEIAVTGFDGAARNSTGRFVTLRGPADRDALKQAIRAVGDNGNWTDFTAGLAEAKRLVDGARKEPGDQEIVVFLTDGRCDPDPQGSMATAPRPAGVRLEEICQRQVVDELVPSMRGVRVYAVGLSRAAPRPFLELLGQRTGGVGVATDTADELPRLFADVYARLLGSKLLEGPSAESIPIQVEEGTLSLDVVLKGPPALTVSLRDPAGAEMAQDNRKPQDVYFVGSDAYRLFKIAHPAIGTWKLGVGGGAKGGRYVALLGMELDLTFVDPPEVVEIGKPARVRMRLATPGGKTAPVSFLDRHELAIRTAESPKDCKAVLLLQKGVATPVKHGPDGTYVVTVTSHTRGELCFEAVLTPGAEGVLTRSVTSPIIRVVPPLHLVGAPVNLGRIKQGERGRAKLSLEGSEIGEPVTLKVELTGRKKGLDLDLDEVKLEPAGARVFDVKVAVDRNAPSGRAGIKILMRPVQPKGYEERALELDAILDVVPLTFWERYGTWIEIGAGVLVLLVLLLGFLLPARFARRALLYYRDVRDPDLPREASYPLGVRARPGFYRGARQLVGPTGPVRTGGVVELRPVGSAISARPLGSGKVRELPREDDSGLGASGEPRDVSLARGSFRVSPGVRYEIEGSGLVFWCTLPARR